MTDPARDSEEPVTSAAWRKPLLGGGVAVAAIVAAAALAGGGSSADPPPPTSTRLAVSSTTVAAPSTLDPFTAEYSPFVARELVSRSNVIPDNPEVADAAAAIYVDPVTGSDTAAGTRDEPVATLEAARDIARRELAAARSDVVVYLRGRVHPRRTTFTLEPADSGRGGHDMVYRSFPGEQAVIEGGVPVAGWKPAFAEVLVAPVPAEVAAMRQFFAAGERQPRARSATAAGVAVEFLRGPLFDRQRNVAMTVATELVADFARPQDLELLYIGVAIEGHGITRRNGTEIRRPSWKSHRLPVTAATDLGQGLTRLDIGEGALHQASERGFEALKILPGDQFFLENALELLDEPGEWYFDEEQRLLYWWPPDRAAIAEAWIPLTEVLLRVDGTPHSPVEDVRIEGIAFRHAGYTVPNESGYVVSQGASWFSGWEPAEWMTYDGAVHSQLQLQRPTGMPAGAVEIDSARNIVLSQNVFTELGAAGLMLPNDVVGATVDGNLFSDISAAALVAGHPAHDVIDEPMEGPIVDLVVTNNIVDAAAAEFYGSVGIQVTKASGAAVSHNVFRDLPYTGLSLGWGWDTNPQSTVHRAIRAENNYFENVMTLLYDASPVYLLGPAAAPGDPADEHVLIRGNFANNVGAPPQYKAPNDSVDPNFAKRPAVQLDAGVRNIQIRENVFAGYTVWFQLTEWPYRRNEPGWVAGLALSGSGNWSDTAAALPADTSLAGIEPAGVFELASPPEVVLAIMRGAGLEPGVNPPPLP